MVTKSIIYSLDKDEFQKLCLSCMTLADILRHFDMHVGAGNYKTLKRRIKNENIDISHMGNPKNRKRPRSKGVLQNKEIFIENCKHGQTVLRRRIRKKNMLEQKCQICGLGALWQKKSITLRIDHINGISNDNRIQNLRMVCPNCDSQLKTYGAKNIKRKQHDPLV